MWSCQVVCTRYMSCEEQKFMLDCANCSPFRSFFFTHIVYRPIKALNTELRYWSNQWKRMIRLVFNIEIHVNPPFLLWCGSAATNCFQEGKKQKTSKSCLCNLLTQLKSRVITAPYKKEALAYFFRKTYCGYLLASPWSSHSGKYLPTTYSAMAKHAEFNLN